MTNNNLSAPDVNDIAALPTFLIEAIGKPIERTDVSREAASDLDTEANVQWAIDFLLNDAGPAIMGGGGDATTFRVACELREQGISEYMALNLMSEHYNETRCDPPWET